MFFRGAMLMRDFFRFFSVGAVGTVKSARSCASVSRIRETMSVERRRAISVLLALGRRKRGRGGQDGTVCEDLWWGKGE